MVWWITVYGMVGNDLWEEGNRLQYGGQWFIVWWVVVYCMGGNRLL